MEFLPFPFNFWILLELASSVGARVVGQGEMRKLLYCGGFQGDVSRV